MHSIKGTALQSGGNKVSDNYGWECVVTSVAFMDIYSKYYALNVVHVSNYVHTR